MMARRVFGKAESIGSSFEVSHSDQTCFELQWFIKRYPMVVEPRDFLNQSAAAHVDRIQTLDEMIDRDYVPRSFKLAVPARHYQQVAADSWLCGRQLLLADDVGLGKAQPLDAQILTPIGWMRMGDAQPGTVVTDPCGGATIITAVFPQGEKDVYRVTTSDGKSTECCDDHLWKVMTPNDRCRGTHRVLPLSEIRQRLFEVRSGQRMSHWFLPLASEVEFIPIDAVRIKPYLLGVLIGDGGLGGTSTLLSTADAEILESVKSELPDGIKLVKCKGAKYDYRLSRARIGGHPNLLKMELRRLGLAGKRSWEKFIPKAAATASIEDRWELLKGLMDTDGTCDVAGASCTFTTTSQTLADDVENLVGSLGGFTTKYSRRTKFSHKGEKRTGRVCYTVNIRVPKCPFKLKAKASRWRMPNLARSIRSVEYIGRKEVQCIKVANDAGLYVTDNFIVTHNTASAIAAMTAKEVQPVLVATLANLPMQWKGEINKFAPDLYCHILKKGTPYELPKKNGRGPDVIISSYHKLVGWCDVLAEYCKSFVGDEIQELRHSSSQKYTAARRITSAVEYRIGLSATPIYNFGEEFYNIGQQLFPGALGTRDEFAREWLSGKRLKDPDAFGAWLRDQHLMLRRTRKDVGRELPALQKITVPVDSDEQALKQVEGRAGELARLIMNGGAGPRGAAMNAAGEFDSLMRQATGLAKAPYVAAFVEMLLEQGTPVVLFGWHHAVYEVWMQQLSRWNPRLYTGRQSNTQKQESFNAFVNGETNLLILSLRSGAGLDGLQRRCCTTVHGEFDWSPGVIEQDIGRVFRDGQENPVQAFMMLSDSGSDPLMAEVIGLKTNDIEGLRGRTRVLQRIDSGNTLRKLAEQYLKRHAAQGL